MKAEAEVLPMRCLRTGNDGAGSVAKRHVCEIQVQYRLCRVFRFDVKLRYSTQDVLSATPR